MIDGARANNLEPTLLLVEFSYTFDYIHRGKIKLILLAYDLSKGTVTAIMRLYKNTDTIVLSPNGDSDFFDIVAEVLQRDTLVLYLYIK